ncbi:MAG: NAD(P)H-hydrate dehydratase, partial [Phycisphaerales bacterium]|nr:NAD(P)H-hydrate dehydratase [Phycisphaerales bacterium]
PVGRDGGLVGGAGLKELEYAAGASRAVVLGPGLGDGAGVSALVRRAWRGLGVPLVLDADGLNRLSDARLGPARGQAVVTPHPGEARRLMERYGVEGDPTSARERERVAAELATAMECVAVLKGARTVVSDGTRVYVNTSGGPVLATGGTGDVLAGVIGGLIAQGANPFTAACLGVLAHGRAGDAWARERRAPGGMLAAELAGQIAREVERLRG